MKKLTVLIVFVTFTLMSCGNSKVLEINGQDEEIETFGWFDLDAKNECVNYQVVTGNVVWSVILSASVVVPAIITGLELWEPVSVKKECRSK